MTAEFTPSSPNPQVAALRARVTTALLTRNRGEARELLGKLISLLGSQIDKENLCALVDRVKQEVDYYIADAGSIRNRLLSGTPLESIQRDLDSKIPYWRAFANDFPEIKLARDGLPAYQDPRIKLRLKVIEQNLAAGAIGAALDLWGELGPLCVTAGGGFHDVMSALRRCSVAMANKDWAVADNIRNEAMGLLGSHESASYRQGCEIYLTEVGTIVGWELYLDRISDVTTLSKLERQNALKELYNAKSQFEQFGDTDSWGKKTLDRVNSSIEKIEQLELRIRSIKNKLSEGKVVEAVAGWKELGTLAAAEGVDFDEILDVLSRLFKAIETNRWGEAVSIFSKATMLLDATESISYRQEFKDYLEKIGTKLGWETLLERSASPSTVSKPERLKMLEQLHAAQIQLRLSPGTVTSLKETLERVNKRIEEIKQIPEAPHNEGGIREKLQVLVVLIFLVVTGAIGCWVWSSHSSSN